MTTLNFPTKTLGGYNWGINKNINLILYYT